VECRADTDLIDETPAAYKDINLVMDEHLVDVAHSLQ
jgi:RNA-splicing ligase RtcB